MTCKRLLPFLVTELLLIIFVLASGAAIFLVGVFLLIGFAAETDNNEENALAKLKSKNLDMIAANDVSESGAGFSSDTNRVRIYFSDKYDNRTSAEISGSKWEVASGILDQIAQTAGRIK